MKTLAISLVALGLLAGTANARNVQRVFADLQKSAPRSVFDQLNETAPKSYFDQLRDSAPRSDGVFGDLERNAP